MSSETRKRDLITVRLTLAEAQALQLAAGELPYILANTAAIFQMLYSGKTGGWLDDEDRGVVAVLDFMGKALDRVSEEEGEEIGKFDLKLRTALSEVNA